MAIDFAMVASIVKTAYDVYTKLKSISATPEPSTTELLQAIRQVGSLVEKARTEIISEIWGTTLAALAGDVNGLAVRFEEYTIYDKDTQHDPWVSEGERLREIIDDGADALGHLEEELNARDLNEITELEYGAKIFPVFAIAIPLRAAAMLERTRHYQTEDAAHIPAMRTRLYTQTGRLLPMLHLHSDQRFSNVQTRRGEPAGGGKYYWQVYYEFEGEPDIVAEVLENKVSAAVKKARKTLAQHKERVFLSYLCVPVIGTTRM